MTEPLSEIESGLFSSPQIKKYITEGYLVRQSKDKKIDDNTLKKHLKSATYDMTLGNFATITKNGEKKYICLSDEFDKKTLTLKPNSLTFVTTHEEFNLPKNVIARFNLKGKLIHKGLLLGTGPIVDPEFQGKILIPIYNFSSSPVQIDYLDPIISVEFTKTLSPTPSENYVINKNWEGDPKKYSKNSGAIESSVFTEINFLKKRYDFTWMTIISLFVAFFACIIAFIVGGYQILTAIDSRIDTVISTQAQREIDKKSNNNIQEIYINEKLNILNKQANTISEKLNFLENTLKDKKIKSINTNEKN